MKNSLGRGEEDNFRGTRLKGKSSSSGRHLIGPLYLEHSRHSRQSRQSRVVFPLTR